MNLKMLALLFAVFSQGIIADPNGSADDMGMLQLKPEHSIAASQQEARWGEAAMEFVEATTAHWAKQHGWTDHDFVLNGVHRKYACYICPGCEGQTVPLLLVAPGTHNSRWLTPLQSLTAYAKKESYVIVEMQGQNLSFNVGGAESKPDAAGSNPGVDDEQYVLDVVGHLKGFTRGSTFCTGFSRGGRFCAELMASQRLQAANIHFTAYAPVESLRFSFPMHGSPPIPVVAVHEVDDPTNPYCGHGPVYWNMSVPDAIRAWAKWNSCDDPTENTTGCSDPCVQVNDYETYDGYYTYYQCSPCKSAPNTKVLLAKGKGNKHRWAPHSVDIIFNFFAQYKGTTITQSSGANAHPY